jgi:hypothetical protein
VPEDEFMPYSPVDFPDPAERKPPDLLRNGHPEDPCWDWEQLWIDLGGEG